MKPFSEVLEEYLNELVNELKRTGNDEVIGEVAEDLSFNHHFKILMEELVIYCLKHNLLVNSFSILKYVSRNQECRINAEFFQHITINELKEIDWKEIDEEYYEQISEGLVFCKGSLYLMLERRFL